MNPLKIIIVDDSPVFREGLKFFIENILSCEVIAEAADGSGFLQLKNKHIADIILMDIQMPEQNGIETVLKDQNNHLRKFIAISGFEDDVYLYQLVHAGFKGFLNKRNIYRDLKDAIVSVTEGKLFFPDSLKINNQIQS